MKRNDGTIANCDHLMMVLGQASQQTNDPYLKGQIEKGLRVLWRSQLIKIQMEIRHAREVSDAPNSMKSSYDPPTIAEFLLTMLLKPSHVDGVIGDLKQHFESECRRLGRRHAVWRYWRRTFESLLPLLRRAVTRTLKWGAVIAGVRRLF